MDEVNPFTEGDEVIISKSTIPYVGHPGWAHGQMERHLGKTGVVTAVYNGHGDVPATCEVNVPGLDDWWCWRAGDLVSTWAFNMDKFHKL